jgi:phage gp36-like protein
MPYATPAQMVARFTEREVVAITDRAGAGEVDLVQLGAALVDASAEIDMHLGRRYALPLARAGVVMVTAPTVLVGLCCDIARYRLTGTEVQETEAIRNRYKDATKMLAQLADGSIVLAESPDLVSASNPNSQGAAVQTNERCREFSKDSLGTY